MGNKGCYVIKCNLADENDDGYCCHDNSGVLYDYDDAWLTSNR